MNAITFHLPPEVQRKIREIAEAEGMSIDVLLGDFAAHMVKQYEGQQLFLEMSNAGAPEVDKALELLRR
ncbi:MAG: hypothetical protein KL863_23850 [Rhizobium sp.]|nr:hypothetical protein [Rhizobium sp.]